MLERAGREVVEALASVNWYAALKRSCCREVVGVFAAERVDVVAAVPVGRAGLVLVARKRLEADGIVGRAVEHEPVALRRAAGQSAHEAALVGVAAALDASRSCCSVNAFVTTLMTPATACVP